MASNCTRFLSSVPKQKQYKQLFRFFHKSKSCTYINSGINYSKRKLYINEHQRFYQANKRLTAQNTLNIRNYSVSATGFNDYEAEKKNFKIVAPEFFNFSEDVIEKWAHAELYKGRTLPALWWVDEEGNEVKWGFAELHTNSKRVANVLSESCGLQKGDRVIVILPRIPEWWLLNLACIRTGTVLIPGTTLLRSKDIKHRLMLSGATAIITNDQIAPYADEVTSECPNLRCKLLVSEKPAERQGWLNFNQLYSQASEDHECVKTRSSDPMQIFFTSGTTGHPKMAEHTHASYGLGHITTGRFWLDLTENDIIFNMSDTGWAKAAYSSVFGPWVQGACVFVLHNEKFEPVKTSEILEMYPITVMCAAPTIFRYLVQQDLTKYAFPTLRHCLSAGEALNPEVTEAFYKGTGKTIREGYGQTETTVMVGSFLCIPNKPGSMGKPAPGYEVKIIDEDAQEVHVGVEGDIAIRCKPERPVGLFSCYVDEPERTARSHRGDYYLLGDRAKRDEDGYFWFVARADDIISSAGYRIGPFEVESALIEHPAVAESAVVSSPDQQRGEVVKAFVILTDSYKNADEAALMVELQDFVKTQTAPYKYPRKIEFVETLPKTISGKIRRIELKEREWSSHLSE